MSENSQDTTKDSRKQRRRVELGQWKSRLKGHAGIRNYYKDKKAKGSRAFWNQFRIELMRRSPDELKDFLESQCEATGNDSRLAEVEGLSKKLLDHLPDNQDERRLSQEALILFCLAKDAAWRLKQLKTDDPAVKKQKNALHKALSIWEVP